MYVSIKNVSSNLLRSYFMAVAVGNEEEAQRILKLIKEESRQDLME